MDLLEKLMICAAGAAEHTCQVENRHGRESEEFAIAWGNQKAAVKAVEAQKNLLKQQGLMAP